jgi:hypothetical protein
MIRHHATPTWVYLGGLALATTAGTINAVGFLGQHHQSLSHLSGTVTFLGFPVFELTPDSAGMGVGFTVTVKAPIDKVRKSFETALGKTLKGCESSDGLTTCSLQLAPKRTALLVSPTNKPEVGTLAGCYYEYQK